MAQHKWRVTIEVPQDDYDELTAEAAAHRLQQISQRMQEAVTTLYADAEVVEVIIASQDDELYDPVEAFRESWEDALAGRTYPLDTLWDDLADE